MMPNAIREISSGGRRRASLSGTRLPSTRNIGGRPALRWMSEAPPRSATCRISFSSIAPPLGLQRTIAAPRAGTKVPDRSGTREAGGPVRPRPRPPYPSFALRRVDVPAGVLLDRERQRLHHLQEL